jgi:hypothetical protein
MVHFFHASSAIHTFSSKPDADQSARSDRGHDPGEVLFEIERSPARRFDYVVSVLIVAHLRRSPVYFLKAGESAFKLGLP